MGDLFRWLAHWEHTGTFLLFLFFITFLGIIVYVMTGKERGERLESYKNIPFQDDELPAGNHHQEHRKDVRDE